jgi:hypothetical protein
VDQLEAAAEADRAGVGHRGPLCGPHEAREARQQAKAGQSWWSERRALKNCRRRIGLKGRSK